MFSQLSLLTKWLLLLRMKKNCGYWHPVHHILHGILFGVLFHLRMYGRHVPLFGHMC